MHKYSLTLYIGMDLPICKNGHSRWCLYSFSFKSGAKGCRDDPANPLGNYPDEKGEVEHEATVNSALLVLSIE